MEVEDAKRRCNFIDYMADNSYNFRQDGIPFRYILMKFTVLFRRKEDSCEGTVNIEEADVLIEILLFLLAAAFLFSPILIVWAYHKKGKIPISIACGLSLVLFLVDGIRLRCLLVWLVCLLLAITMRRKY